MAERLGLSPARMRAILAGMVVTGWLIDLLLRMPELMDVLRGSEEDGADREAVR